MIDTVMTSGSAWPKLIQGGMGVGVSNWRLARAVSARGHLGLVSGVAIDLVLVRRLEDGDPDGHMRNALRGFPVPAMVDEVIEKHFRPGGRSEGQPYRHLPAYSHASPPSRYDLSVLGSFAEITLAKEGHHNPVGLNLLTKMQIPTIACLYGAMLAGVDYVVMGAGIPREIPGILDALSEGRAASLRLDVTGLTPGDAPVSVSFDPARYGVQDPIKRPAFLPIVASHTLATMLSRKSTGSIQGLVVEGPTAGGHNAPPRGTPTYDDLGQPLYGERDVPDLAAIHALGLPFWLAGGMTTPARVAEAMKTGAAGVQVGTLFAFCRESGIEPALRQQVIEMARRGEAAVFTDARASSTGYPFKVVPVAGSLSEDKVYLDRTRICDLGYLRETYSRDNGSLGYRCAAEPVADYLRKGGRLEDTVGRKCLCNGLAATIGLGQFHAGGGVEAPIVTSGDDLPTIRALLGDDGEGYSADDVIDYLLPAGSAAHV
jgi:NAD(P)H-dependent flavin oxidoreductase YrpB (nitropropane dioxygenase family)